MPMRLQAHLAGPSDSVHTRFGHTGWGVQFGIPSMERAYRNYFNEPHFQPLALTMQRRGGTSGGAKARSVFMDVLTTVVPTDLL